VHATLFLCQVQQPSKLIVALPQVELDLSARSTNLTPLPSNLCNFRF